MRRSETGGGSAAPHGHGAKTSYFTYTDANGVQVIVDRLADVPAPYRDQAKAIDLSQPALQVTAVDREAAPVATTQAIDTRPSSGRLCLGQGTGCVHATSFLVGAAVALVLGGAGMLLFRKSARLVAIVAGMLVVAALTTAVLTYARRQAGLPGDGLVTPGVLLDDARAAAKAMDEHQREQARSLGELDPQK